VSAALLRRYRHSPVRYWKPVQTGIEQDDDTAEVQRLAGSGEDRVLDAGVRLPRPVSPHLAAKMNGSSVEVHALAAIAEGQTGADRWIVEGAGGVLVPLNEEELLVDLIARLSLPVLVVSRSGLGTINHTLLTAEALRLRQIPVAGVVMVGPSDAENRLAIERYGRLEVVAEMPTFKPFELETFRNWVDQSFDRDGRLSRYLR
jgi:dethiobiotin synthetase